MLFDYVVCDALAWLCCHGLACVCRLSSAGPHGLCILVALRICVALSLLGAMAVKADEFTTFVQSVVPDRTPQFVDSIVKIFGDNDISSLAHLRMNGVEQMVFGSGVTAGKKACLFDCFMFDACVVLVLQGAVAEVIRKFKEEIAETEGVKSPESEPAEDANGVFPCLSRQLCVFLAMLAGSWVENAFRKALGLTQKPCVHVDMMCELGKRQLADHFPSAVWPPTNAVREMASRLKAVRATGQPNVFVCVELKK